MKLLLVHPGAGYSTADVESGLRYGLEQHGVDLVQYRLDERIDRSRRWLFHAWRTKRKVDPHFEKPTIADVFYQAGIGALERALRHQVDAVIVVSAMFLHPDVMILLRRAGVRVTVLFTESPYDHEKEIAVAKLVDGCWTSERAIVDSFRAVNPRIGYVPHGFHPLKHRPGVQAGDEQVPEHDVVFVGSAFAERIEFLDAIDWTGIDLGLYGNWASLPSRHRLRAFLKDDKPIDNARTAALYRRARIGLNLYRSSMGWGRAAPRLVRGQAESLNPRGYELAACGAFHLSTYRAEIPEIFGDLVPTFETPAEASELIRVWLADHAGRARVAAELPGRVVESSWTHRAVRVIGDVRSLSRAA